MEICAQWSGDDSDVANMKVQKLGGLADQDSGVFDLSELPRQLGPIAELKVIQESESDRLSGERETGSEMSSI